MKLYSYVCCCICLLLASFISCSKADDSPEELPPPITIPDEMLTITSPCEAGSKTISFVATTSWVIEAPYNWLQVSPKSGGAGNIALTIKIEANTIAANRSATISIKAGGEIYEVSVTQKAALATFSINPNDTIVSSETGIFDVNIISNHDWSTSNIPDWVTLSAESGKGNQLITVSYLANEEAESRHAIVTFTSGNLSQTLTLTQEGKTIVPTLSIDKTAANVEASSGSFTMNVTSNSDWSTSGIPAWVTLLPAQGKGNKAVTVSYQSNESYAVRNAVITFTAAGKSQTLTITQQGKSFEPTLSIDKTLSQVQAASGSFTMNVISNSDWSTSGIPAWITLSATQGKGNKVVIVSYLANDRTESRSAVITFSCGDQSQTLTITQEAKVPDPTLSIDKTAANVEAASGSFTMNVTSNSDWSTSGIPAWVTLLPAQGKGNKAVTVSYQSNESYAVRNAVITFIAAGKSQTLTITQQGKSFEPTLSIDKTLSQVQAASGSFTMNVTSNSDWSTSGIPAWITLSPTQGKGNKVVIVSYLANDRTESRNAVITFSCGDQSQTLTITQEAKVPDPTLSIDKTAANVEAFSGSFTMNVTSNSDWSTSGIPSWVTLSPAQGKGNKSVTVSYQSNESYAVRNAAITFTAAGKSQTLTITQQGKSFEPTLSIDKTLSQVQAASGSFTMNVTSNSDWSTSGIPAWVTLSPTQGKGNKVVIVSYLANDRTESRSAVITFSCGDQSQTLTITQEAKVPDPTLSIDKTAANVQAASGSFTMNVTSNSDWSTSGIPSWVTLSPAQGKGNKSVTVSYQTNTGTELRSATVVFLVGTIRKTLTITQAGMVEDDKIELSRYAISAGASLAQVQLSVVTNTAWQVSNVPSWITVSPGSGTKNGTVTIGWEANLNAAERSATLRFTAGTSYKEIVVTQAGQYILTMETTALQFKSDESSQAITFYANGAWSISVDQEWLSLSTSSGYDGNQQVTVYTARHQGDAVRNGTITVTVGTGAGKVSKQIKVTQTPQPTLSVSSTQLKAPFQTSSYNVALTSNTTWSAVSNQAWCTVSPASGSGNGSIKLSVERNSVSQSRVAVVTLKAGSQAAGYISKTITITQNAYNDFSITDWGDNGDHGGAAQ